jgi:hypothetical protein
MPPSIEDAYFGAVKARRVDAGEISISAEAAIPLEPAGVCWHIRIDRKCQPCG